MYAAASKGFVPCASVRGLHPALRDQALVEAARALGNITRHEDARHVLLQLRVDEVRARDTLDVSGRNNDWTNIGVSLRQFCANWYQIIAEAPAYDPRTCRSARSIHMRLPQTP